MQRVRCVRAWWPSLKVDCSMKTILMLANSQQWKCFWCDRYTKRSNCTIEHLIPRRLMLQETYLAMSCKDCNKDRGPRLEPPGQIAAWARPIYAQAMESLLYVCDFSAAIARLDSERKRWLKRAGIVLTLCKQWKLYINRRKVNLESDGPQGQ